MVQQVVGGPKGCTGLSKLGQLQARALRNRLEVEAATADVVLSSTLPRARETANALADVLGPTADALDDLCELRPGACDGMSWQDWRQRFLVDMGSEPDVPISPGGESHNQFAERVRTTLERIVETHEGKTVVAVCHGGVIQASFAAFIGSPLFQQVRSPEPTSITEWWHSADETNAGTPWNLVRYNDAAHLKVKRRVISPSSVLSGEARQ